MPTETLAATNPFATMEFLEALGDYRRGSGRQPEFLAEDPYLGRLFSVRSPWKVFRAIEARGAGAADYMDLDWRRVSRQRFIELCEAVVQSRDVDLIALPRVRGDALLGRYIEEWAGLRRLPLLKLPYDVAPYLPLEGTWDAFYAQKGSKVRYNLRWQERKLAEMGGLSFLHAVTPEEVERHLPSAFDLYSKRSQSRYQASLWLAPEGQALLRRMARQFAKAGRADLAFLSVGGKPIAFSYGFHNEQDYFFYATAFDAAPRFSPYGPGVLLVKHLLERAFQSGFRRFDFMTGDEPYKRTWAAHQEVVYTYLVGKRTLMSRAAFSFYGAWLRARQRVRTSRRLRALARKALPLRRR